MSRNAEGETPAPAQRVWKPTIYRGYRYIFAAYFSILIFDLFTAYDYHSERSFPYVLDLSFESAVLQMLIICAVPLAILCFFRASPIELRDGLLLATRGLFGYRQVSEVIPAESLVAKGRIWNRDTPAYLTLRNGTFRADVLRRELGDEAFDALLKVATKDT